MAVLVVQSFGKEYEYKRAIFSVLSYYAVVGELHSAAETLLFTDNPAYFADYFSGLPVQYVALTEENIRAMKGEINFLHRMKIAVLEEAFQRAGDDLIYADSDTFFTENPARLLNSLTSEVSFMHKQEYTFQSLENWPLPAGTPFRAFLNLISSKTFILPDGSNLNVVPSHVSWNAGVMMLHHSHLQLLPLVYDLTDQFYPATRNHASEQYAFSVVLQNQTTVNSCDSVIFHYWHRIQKAIVDEFLSTKVNSDFATLPRDRKLALVLKWTRRLPRKFDRHVLTWRDNAIQAFNTNNFIRGYYYGLATVLRKPRDMTFLRDILYHTKRLIRRRNG